MRLLVDTHVWLWMFTEPERLNDSARSAIAAPENEAMLSAASAWELAIKHALGKLPLRASPAQLIEVSVRELQMTMLPISVAHALAAATLPPHHRDPFDRMLVAQAQIEGLTLLSGDDAVRQYGGALLWAV